MEKTCILILGMHRSGTSALSGTLSLLDVYFGNDLLKADSSNPKGYFENNAFYKLNKIFLEQIQSSWDDVFYTEDKLLKHKSTDNLKHTLEKEFGLSQLFAIKDPRLTILFPIYKHALDELNIKINVLIPYRNPVEIANSLSVRNDFSIEKGLLLWSNHFLLAEKFSRDLPRVFINYDDLIASPEAVINNISNKLGLELINNYSDKKSDIASFLDPCLKHHNIAINKSFHKVPKFVSNIWVLKDKFNTEDLKDKFDEIRHQLFDYQNLFYNTDIKNSLADSNAKNQQITQLKQELKSKDQQITQLKQELKSKDQEITQFKKGLNAKDIKIKKLNVQKEKLETELIHLYESKSWRYTRPLRVVVRKMKKGKS